MYRVNVWDVDGCMVLHQFPGGKQNADITKDKPFKWVIGEALKGNVNIMVSGRGSELKDVTLQWWRNYDIFNRVPMQYVGVDWKHQETHDQRMDDYIFRKVSTLCHLISAWCMAMRQSGFDDYEIHVYEDDESVLRGMRKDVYDWDTNKGLHIVRDGKLSDYV